jgi:hypothetical protein
MKLTTWTAQGIGASIQIEGTDEAGEYQIIDDVVEIKNDVRRGTTEATRKTGEKVTLS